MEFSQSGEEEQLIGKQTNLKAEAILSEDFIVAIKKMARLHEPQQVTGSTASSSTDQNKVLPKDWVVESKTQKNGKRTYKCYIDPITSRKFYSIQAVTRYLEDLKSLNGTSNLAETSKPAETSKQSQTKVQIERRVNVDGLPEKWILEIVSKKVGGKTRKDLFYIDPETGYAFHSKPDALRYLKSGDIEKCAIKPKKRDLKTLELINDKTAPPATKGVTSYLEDLKSLNGSSKQAETSKQSQTKVQIERRVNVDGLPEKWILEIVSKKVGGKTRKDLFYIDPETGYAFHSKPDALRYLRSGDIEKCAIKPKKRDLKTMELINVKTAPPATERKKLEVAQCSHDLEPVFSLHNVIPESEYESKYAPIPGEEWANPSSIAPLKPEVVQSGTSNKRGWKSKKLQSKKGPAIEKLVSTQAQLMTAMPSGDQLVENGVRKDENGKTKGGLHKRKEKKEPDTPRQASKRVAGVLAETSSLLASQQSLAKAKQVVSPIAAGSNNSTTSQFNDLGVKAAREGEGFVNNCVHQLDGQPNSCAMPVTDQASLEKLGAGKNIDDMAGSSVTLPLVKDLSVHDYWQDPCLEFAFKTLTGAIPVDNNLLVLDYLQQQVGSPQTQNTNGTALKDLGVEILETDNLLQFDEKVSSETQLDKPTMKQSVRESKLDSRLQQQCTTSF